MIERRPHVCISYSHADHAWKERLVTQLRVLERQGVIDVWDDNRIAAGSDWRTEMQDALDVASIAVLLVSSDFLASAFIQDEEVPRLLERNRKDGLLILPVILRPCDWRAVGWLNALEVFPQNGRPVSRGNDHEVDAAYAMLATKIRKKLKGAHIVPALRTPAETMSPTLGRNRVSLIKWVLFISIVATGGIMVVRAQRADDMTQRISETGSTTSIIADSGAHDEVDPLDVAILRETLRPIYFISGSANLDDRACATLDEYALELKASKWSRLLVKGHTRAIDPSSNTQLGKERANAVTKYLVARGIDSRRLQIISYGGEQPPLNGNLEYTPRVELQLVP